MKYVVKNIVFLKLFVRFLGWLIRDKGSIKKGVFGCILLLVNVCYKVP